MRMAVAASPSSSLFMEPVVISSVEPVGINGVVKSKVTNGDTYSTYSTHSTHSQTSQDSGTSTTSDESPMPVKSKSRPKCNGCHASDKEESLRRHSDPEIEVKDPVHCRLQEELMKALQALKLKDEECKELKNLEDRMNREIEDLTASLFEEANKMVQEANIKRINQEKLLKEANAKTEILQAEVTALKSLVITSTPSMPNRHLHPQLVTTQRSQGTTPNNTQSAATSPASSGGSSRFIKGHRRSTSHHNISREITLTELSPTVVPVNPAWPQHHPHYTVSQREFESEVNAQYFSEFKQWKENSPSLNIPPSSPFLDRVIKHDIRSCLEFPNQQMSEAVFDAILHNTLTIDPLQDNKIRQCALTENSQICRFNLRLKDSTEPGHLICPMARNRITAVCDLITYLRYICQGIVKSDEKTMYWEVMRLQKQICLARLGFS